MNYATVNDLCARYTRTRLDILTRPKTADGQPDDAVAEHWQMLRPLLMAISPRALFCRLPSSPHC